MKQITLPHGQYALVDDDDFEWLAASKWRAGRIGHTYYVDRPSMGCHKDARRERMHRIVMSRMLGRALNKGEDVDHVNGNGLDNQRANLRVTTRSQNLRNRHWKSPLASSKYVGVCWCKQTRRWAARIRIGGKKVHIGRYSTEDDAMLAREEFIAGRPELNARSNLAEGRT